VRPQVTHLRTTPTRGQDAHEERFEGAAAPEGQVSMNSSMSRARLVLLTLVTCGLSQACVLDDGDDDPERSACPADDPDCDRLDSPCVAEESADGAWPSSGPTGLTASLKDNGDYRVWPNGRVPYVFNSSVGSTTKQRALAAMEEWQSMSHGVVRFEKKLPGESAYMKFVAGGTVTSHVGYRKGTVSEVALRNPEYLTVIRHEIGHVLGLHHEQRRSDRLDHIKVKSANVVGTSRCESQFNVCSSCVDVLGYNVKSIMQYRTSDLASCRLDGKPVVLHLDGSAIKHEWIIRPKDILAIEELYGG
jgi:hypothetical protein